MKPLRMIALFMSLFFTVLLAQSFGADHITILHSFNPYERPNGGLVLDGSTLYGTTRNGGKFNSGSIYSVNTDGSNFQILHTFNVINDNGNGVRPVGPLVLNGSTLYGMTPYVSSADRGTIYSINTDGSNFQVLHSLSLWLTENTDIEHGLILSDSTLYGAVSTGGEYGKGTIFSINTDGSNFKVLKDFYYFGGNDAAYPVGNLVLSGSTLYGMTWGGGSDNVGTFFSIDTDGNNYQILHSFQAGTGYVKYPVGSLVLSGSTLYGYGMTGSGGQSDPGTIFSIDTDGGNLRVLHSFKGGIIDGKHPVGGLALSGSKLYGMTEMGGPSDSGTIFSIDTDGSNFQVLRSLPRSLTDVSYPHGTLLASGATFYGTTLAGGRRDQGTVFSFTPGILPGLPLLTVAKSGPGTIASSFDDINCGDTCSGSFTKGTRVALTPIPDTGSAFTGWSGGCKGNRTCAVTMRGDITVGATFEADSCTYNPSRSAIRLGYRGGAFNIGIKAGKYTYCLAPDITNDATSWMSYEWMTPSFTNNRGSIVVYVPQNDGAALRTGVLTLQGGKTVTVQQKGKQSK